MRKHILAADTGCTLAQIVNEQSPWPYIAFGCIVLGATFCGWLALKWASHQIDDAVDEAVYHDEAEAVYEQHCQHWFDTHVMNVRCN